LLPYISHDNLLADDYRKRQSAKLADGEDLKSQKIKGTDKGYASTVGITDRNSRLMNIDSTTNRYQFGQSIASKKELSEEKRRE